MADLGWSYPAGAANDPCAPYNQTEDTDDFSELIAELGERGSRHWRWDQIHCCLSGKDGDLDPTGDQGIEVLRSDETTVTCAIHISCTHADVDVCLNLPSSFERDATDEQHEAIAAIYSKRSVEIVCNTGHLLSPSHDGDCWNLSGYDVFTAHWVMSSDGETPDYSATADAVIVLAEAAMEPLEAEAIDISDQLSVLAGWSYRNSKDKLLDCPNGQPGIESVWTTYNLLNDDV
jgi:hypothetical protein